MTPATSTLPEVSICDGIVCTEYAGQITQWMSNRLRPSSQASIATALRKWWGPFTERWELPEFIITGDPKRGGIMASFVCYMASGGIVYSTIMGYVWAVIDHHTSNGYASPLSNVRDWGHFTSAVEVETHVPAEPRRMFPWLIFLKTLTQVDLTNSYQVGIGLLMLTLFYTISRPELIPLTLTGKNSFDVGKHLCVKHIRLIKDYVEVNIRGIKQDPLCKRPQAIAGEAWRAIGACTGIMDYKAWWQLYLSLRTFENEDSPLLYDEKGQTLTYPAANRGLRKLVLSIPEVSVEDAKLTAFGQIRATGRCVFAALCGDDAAKFQGMWSKNANSDEAYDRPLLLRVLGMPQKMLEFCNSRSMPIKSCLESVAASSDANLNLLNMDRPQGFTDDAFMLEVGKEKMSNQVSLPKDTSSPAIMSKSEGKKKMAPMVPSWDNVAVPAFNKEIFPGHAKWPSDPDNILNGWKVFLHGTPKGAIYKTFEIYNCYPPRPIGDKLDEFGNRFIDQGNFMFRSFAQVKKFTEGQVMRGETTSTIFPAPAPGAASSSTDAACSSVAIDDAEVEPQFLHEIVTESRRDSKRPLNRLAQSKPERKQRMLD